MDNMAIGAGFKNGQIDIQTGSGFGLLAGTVSLDVDGKESRPTSGKAIPNGLEHELHLNRLSEGAFEFRQTVQNRRPDNLEVSNIVMIDARLDLLGQGWQVAHEELFKKEVFFERLTTYTNGLFADLPETEGDFGLSEDFPFPGIFFTHPERGTVLLATISQERCKPRWSIRRDRNGLRLTASDHFSGIPVIPVRPGATFSSETWIVLAVRGSMEDAIEEYFAILRKRINFPGTTSILREAVVWGSWNYNRRPRGHMDITHDMIVANARALPALVGNKPRFIMIDDGYQRGSSRQTGKGWFASCLEIFRADGKLPHDPDLFPHGMKATADAIRDAGCGPAIWVTPRIRRQSTFAQEQPDLFLQFEDRDSFGDQNAYLDYSIPEARDYTRSAWNTLCNEWGYKGVKLDFWSLQFEIPNVRFRNRERTAIELRNLFLQDLRDFVASDGYIITGVVINSGNPLIGRYIDAARSGPDIGNGTAMTLRESAAMLSVASCFYRHDCLLSDADSIAWNPDITAGENRLWATTALLSGAVFEIGGDLTDLSTESAALLKHVINFAEPAQRTLNGLSGPAINRLPANHIVLERADATYEAYLNWARYPREIVLHTGGTDIWTGARLEGKVYVNPFDAILIKR